MNHGKTTTSVVDYQPQTEDFLTNIVDPSAAEATILAESVLPLFHEAGVWIPATREWVVTSNRIKRDDNDDDNDEEQYVIVSSVDINGRVRHLEHDELVMGNGGTSDGAGGVYLCSQGMGRTGGSIWHLDSTLDSWRIVVTGAPRTFMRSDPIDHHHDHHHDDELHFNSPNDVVLYKAKWLLFTDPTYGMEQAFRTTCHLDDLVWVASLGGDNEQIVRPLISEGLVKPNGICLSPDGTVLYVTDTGYVSGTGDVSDKRPRHVLAYDIRLDNDGSPTVTNRRVLFKFYCGGVPDGIKVDVDGNIYVGADDGVRVYKSDGTFLGLLAVEGGVANLCFGGDDWKDLLVLNETRAIKVRMKTAGVRLC